MDNILSTEHWDLPSGSVAVSHVESMSMDQAFDKFMEAAFAGEESDALQGLDAFDGLDMHLFGGHSKAAISDLNATGVSILESRPVDLPHAAEDSHLYTSAPQVKQEPYSNEAWQRLASIARIPGCEAPVAPKQIAAGIQHGSLTALNTLAASNVLGAQLSPLSQQPSPSSDDGQTSSIPPFVSQLLDGQAASSPASEDNLLPPTSNGSSYEHITMGNVESLLRLLKSNSGTAGTAPVSAPFQEPSPTSRSSMEQQATLDEDGRELSAQEKNRAAQRRFRMRQKAKIAGFEQQVEELTAQLQKVTAENSSLKNLNSILEQVLNLRDEHINGLQQAVHVLNPGGKRPIAEIAVAVEDEPEPADAPIQLVQQAAASQHYPEGPLFAAKFPAERMKGLTFDQVVAQYKGYLANIATHILSLEQQQHQAHASSSPQEHGIVHVMIELGSFCERVGMYCPVNLKKLFSHNLESLTQPQEVPAAHWRGVLQVLALTAQQKRDILAARERMITSLVPILAERQQLAAQLAQAASPATMEYVQLSKTSLQSHGVQEALSANVMHEHNCYMEFGIFCFKKVLTLIQNARCWVHSYPFYPDRMAMANLLAAEARELRL